MVSKFKLNDMKSVAAKEAISRTLEIANNYAGELSIEVLPLDKIELDRLRRAARDLHETEPGALAAFLGIGAELLLMQGA